MVVKALIVHIFIERRRRWTRRLTRGVRCTHFIFTYAFYMHLLRIILFYLYFIPLGNSRVILGISS